LTETVRGDDRGDRNSSKQNKKKKSGKPSYRFVDKIRIRAAAGTGGKGSLSLHHISRKRKVRPDGGHGGDGGSVIIFADPNEQSLRMSNPHVQAADGGSGDKQNKYGRKGRNTIVRVPCGVVVKRVLDYNETWDADTEQIIRTDDDGSTGNNNHNMEQYVDEYNRKFEENENDSDSTPENDRDQNSRKKNKDLDFSDDMVGFSDLDIFYGDYSHSDDESDDENFGIDREVVTLADLEKPGDFVVVARGGKGGYGSGLFASLHGGLPDAKILHKNARPQPGEAAHLELELKLIADIGLVGFPNAGKSSLLCAMSRAGPQVAPYPFTTLNPFVGVVEYRDGFRLKAADIPGLIDGASEGKGKGHDFLKHLERTKALLFIVDAAGTDGRDPVEDLRILANELLSYGDGDMLNRQALVVANKLDLLDDDEASTVMADLSEIAEEMGIQIHGDVPVYGISAGVTGVGLSHLSAAMRSVVLASKIGSNDFES